MKPREGDRVEITAGRYKGRRGRFLENRSLDWKNGHGYQVVRLDNGEEVRVRSGVAPGGEE